METGGRGEAAGGCRSWERSLALGNRVAHVPEAVEDGTSLREEQPDLGLGRLDRRHILSVIADSLEALRNGDCLGDYEKGVAHRVGVDNGLGFGLNSCRQWRSQCW